jgi:hypothetical protein
MLLAQFLGIVHEIAPRFLSRRPRNFVRRGHFDPALVAVGHLSPSARAIVGGFVRRRIKVAVVSNFEERVAAAGLRPGGTTAFERLEDWRAGS